LKKALSKYDSNVSVEWTQEEHENYGAWHFIYPRLRKLFNKPIKFHGRKASAATAAGAQKLHKIEEAQLMESIFPTKKN
jgi:2-oxoglutarate dehydrogenase complex dehydrogenase (E1) component-like enzyme